MTVATVSPLAQLALQMVLVFVLTPLSQELWEKEVFRPDASWLACYLQQRSSTQYVDVFDLLILHIRLMIFRYSLSAVN